MTLRRLTLFTMMLVFLVACGATKKDHQLVLSESLLREASDAQQKADYATAARNYYKLHKILPDDLNALLGLAKSLRYIGSATKAANIMSEQKAKYTKEPIFLVEMGKIKLAEGKADKAIIYLKSAQKLEPDNWETYSAMGIAYDMRETYGKALKSYKKALELSPDNPVILNNMAISIAQNGKLDEAIKLLKHASRIERRNPQFRQNLALFHGIKGDIKEAEALARMDLNENDVRKNLAFYYLFKKKHD